MEGVLLLPVVVFASGDGDATQSEARFSMTMTDGDTSFFFSSMGSLSGGESESVKAVGLGVNKALSRRFLRRRRRDEEVRGSSKSSSQAANTAEFCFVSAVISSSSSVTFLESMEYRLRVTSDGSGVSCAVGPSTSYSTACGEPNWTR